MISFEEAYKIVTGSAFSTGFEIIHFNESTGRVLGEDIFSDSDMPPFNRAAVDGYACRKDDIKNTLRIVEVIPAGKEPEKNPGINECARIMTGAIVPDSCDFVFMIEDAEQSGVDLVKFSGINLKSNISYAGEDLKSGDHVLGKGKIITPGDIAVLAATGHVKVKVGKRPVVGIISTGNEIIEPEIKPVRSQVRNSNSYQLMSQVSQAGGIGKYYGIAPDDERASGLISRAVAENDLVILTGGVSMGDYDLVPSFLEKAGVKLIFNRINVQPGKPTTFGVHSRSLVFGLPGNPVSSFVQFETIVRPLIALMMGAKEEAFFKKARLGTSFERKSSSKMGWVPVTIDDAFEVFPVDYHGSAHISAISCSDGIIRILPGISRLEKGTEVLYRQFSNK